MIKMVMVMDITTKNVDFRSKKKKKEKSLSRIAAVAVFSHCSLYRLLRLRKYLPCSWPVQQIDAANQESDLWHKMPLLNWAGQCVP